LCNRICTHGAIKMSLAHWEIFALLGLIVAYGICQADKDSVPKEKDANCNDLIHVNVLSRDVNISRLKGQYVQVQNCEECTNPPFFVYQHQCYEFNGIYLQWFENVKRYEFRKKGEIASLALLHDCKKSCPHQCSNLSAEVVGITTTFVELTIASISDLGMDLESYKVKLKDSEDYNNFMVAVIVVLSLLLLAAIIFIIYQSNNFSDRESRFNLPVICNRPRSVDDDEEEIENAYGGAAQERGRRPDKSKSSKKKD